MLIATCISTKNNMHMYINEYSSLDIARDYIVSEFLETSAGELIDGIISTAVYEKAGHDQFAKDLDSLLYNSDKLEYVG